MSEQGHFNPVELRLLFEALPLNERHLVDHLLGCAACRAALSQQLNRSAAEDSPYDIALGQVIERVAEEAGAAGPRIAEERSQARRLLDDLWTLRRDHWSAFILQHSRPAFLLLVLDTILKPTRHDPDTTETLARLVHTAAKRPEVELPEILRTEILARAWTAAGRARAQREEWAQADAAYGEASLLLNGFPNLEAEAELCRHQAETLAARDRLLEAAALLGRAAHLAGAAGRLQSEIEDLAELAHLHSRIGDPDQAVGALVRAILRAEDAGLSVAAAHLRLRLSWNLRQLAQLADAHSVAPERVRAAMRGDAAEVFISALGQAIRGDTAGAAVRLEEAVFTSLIEGDSLLAALALLTVLHLYILDDNGERLRDLSAATAVLAAPESGLAPATRAAFETLDTALKTETGSLGSLLLAAAAAVDRYEASGPEDQDFASEPSQGDDQP